MAVRLDSLEEKFLNTIKENNLIEKDDVIVVGVSGGPDSITLLTCLNKTCIFGFLFWLTVLTFIV